MREETLKIILFFTLFAATVGIITLLFGVAGLVTFIVIQTVLLLMMLP